MQGSAALKAEGVYYPNSWYSDTMIHLGTADFAYRPCFGSLGAVDFDRTQVHDNTIYVEHAGVQAIISGGCTKAPNKSYTLEEFQSLGEEPGSRRIVGYPSTPAILRAARTTLGQFGASASGVAPTPALTAAAAAAVAQEAATPPKPDVVFILADDLGYNEVGFMNASRGIQTPHLDALAGSGVVLKNYYVAPICSPTRSALMTGRYTIRLGTQSNVIFWDTPWGVSLSESFISEHFKTAGYNTAIFGKCTQAPRMRALVSPREW